MASNAVPGVWRSFGGPFAPSALQCRSCSAAGLDGYDAPTSGASSSGHVSVDTPLSGQFPPAVPQIETFGADKPVYDKSAHPARRYQGYRLSGRVGQLRYPILKPELIKTGSKKEESQAFAGGKKLPIGSAYGRGDRVFPSYSSTSEAIAILRHHQQQGLYIDSHMFVEVLTRCSNEKDLTAATEVHDCIIQSGMDRHPSVARSLVNVYIKCGRLDLGRRVFDGVARTDRNVITWNNLIGAYAKSGYGVEAYRLFLQMNQEGLVPNAITFMSILNASASAGALEWVKDVHSHSLKAELESDVRVGTALVRMYAKSGSIADARLIFNKMEKRNVFTWNVMIGAYAESGFSREAYALFLQMNQEGFVPDAITFMSILNASASAGALEWVKEVHGHVCRAKLESDLRVGSSLVHMYAKSGSIDEARQVFDKMEKRDIVTWNVMIGAYAESGFGMEAYDLFLHMNKEGFIPDAITFTSILNASASAGALERVKEVHGHVCRAKLESDLRVGSALVHMYAKSGSIDEARQVFNKMGKRDVFTWTVMIGAYAESGFGMEAYGLFLQMIKEGFIPDAVTFMSILNASGSAGALGWVKEVHGHVRRAKLESDLRVGSALVHMYAKSGSIDEARVVFDKMENRNVVAWTAMIGGLAQHGCGHEALELFRKMIADGVKPNETTFVAVFSGCSHAGLLDDARRLFPAMRQNYGIEPTVVHYTCMVDLLGRAGHLEEANLLIRDMPVEPDGATWGALLGACRTYGNVQLGEIAAEKLLELEPENASAYVVLANIYAAAGMWERVPLVRTRRQKRGVRKDPGLSWIEVDDKIHEFVVGDTSHPEAKAIYSVLQNLTEELKAEGYIPDTQLVLHDLSEEDKELALCSHSEKMAIAYGIMHIPRGKPIRVFKNLRVCSDCHVATKFISKVTGREIIARDANRFHHFKDGVCSCGDYW